MGAIREMSHDNLHEETLWSKISVMIAANKVPDKHINHVIVRGAGYFLSVVVCINPLQNKIITSNKHPPGS